MRQEFIAPTFLPTITESFLRDDFFFSGYLNRYNLNIKKFIFLIIIIEQWPKHPKKHLKSLFQV
jgi:hypothetical protein